MAERLTLRRLAYQEAVTGRPAGMGTSSPGGPLRAEPDRRLERKVRRLCTKVAKGGDAALLRLRAVYDGLGKERLWYGPEDFAAALAGLDPVSRGCIESAAARIRSFALAQRDCLRPLSMAVPGGEAGHEILAVERAGCYIPGGRYPLVSSALMTVIPARAAGVGMVLTACPRPRPEILAACAVGGADGMLVAGGAQAIAALAYGTETVPACDVVVGPGNRWVAAAKQFVSSRVRIDTLAGPSELLVVADDLADPRLVAADLLAQAEHDPEARVMLACASESFIVSVEAAINELAPGLASYPLIKAAMRGAWACPVLAADAPDRSDASDSTEEVYRRLASLANQTAAEHLSIMVAEPERLHALCLQAGAVFLGGLSAEVVGDYGLGPNHTLPTGQAARQGGGLSVFDFLRVRTFIRLEDGQACRPVLEDAVTMAGMEGLEAHRLSASLRLG